MSDYWEEVIDASLNDLGIKATREQIATIAGDVDTAREHYGLATGLDAVPNPMLAEVRRVQDSATRDRADLEKAHASKVDGMEWEIQRLRGVVADLRERLREAERRAP